MKDMTGVPFRLPMMPASASASSSALSTRCRDSGRTPLVYAGMEIADALRPWPWLSWARVPFVLDGGGGGGMLERDSGSAARSMSVRRCLVADSGNPGILCLMGPFVDGGPIGPPWCPCRVFSSLCDVSRSVALPLLCVIAGSREGCLSPLGRTFSSCEGGRSMLASCPSDVDATKPCVRPSVVLHMKPE